MSVSWWCFSKYSTSLSTVEKTGFDSNALKFQSLKHSEMKICKFNYYLCTLSRAVQPNDYLRQMSLNCVSISISMLCCASCQEISLIVSQPDPPWPKKSFDHMLQTFLRLKASEFAYSHNVVVNSRRILDCHIEVEFDRNVDCYEVRERPKGRNPHSPIHNAPWVQWEKDMERIIVQPTSNGLFSVPGVLRSLRVGFAYTDLHASFCHRFAVVIKYNFDRSIGDSIGVRIYGSSIAIEWSLGIWWHVL